MSEQQRAWHNVANAVASGRDPSEVRHQFLGPRVTEPTTSEGELAHLRARLSEQIDESFRLDAVAGELATQLREASDELAELLDLLAAVQSECAAADASEDPPEIDGALRDDIVRMLRRHQRPVAGEGEPES